MKLRWLQALLIGILFLGICGLLVRHMGSSGAAIQAESRPVVERFFTLCRARDYKQAHGLFTQEQRGRLSLEQFTQRWQQFEEAHGEFQKWQPVAPRVGMPSSTNLWPQWIQTTYAAQSAKSGAVVQLKLVPQDGSWRIDRMNIQL
jgi:hypothetical protein